MGLWRQWRPAVVIALLWWFYDRLDVKLMVAMMLGLVVFIAFRLEDKSE